MCILTKQGGDALVVIATLLMKILVAVRLKKVIILNIDTAIIIKLRLKIRIQSTFLSFAMSGYTYISDCFN